MLLGKQALVGDLRRQRRAPHAKEAAFLLLLVLAKKVGLVEHGKRDRQSDLRALRGRNSDVRGDPPGFFIECCGHSSRIKSSMIVRCRGGSNPRGISNAGAEEGGGWKM